ncbi:MAG: hypothetical protein R8K20_05545 [Gallionellaceae bacterium]
MSKDFLLGALKDADIGKNLFAGIERPAPPTEINESVQEIIDVYSFELFDSAISRSADVRQAAEETLQMYKDFAKRQWLLNQVALTKVWNDPDIEEFDMPLVTIQLNDLEGLLAALQVAIGCGEGALEKMYANDRRRELSRLPAWYTRPLIEMCNDIRTSKPHGASTAEEIFRLLEEVPVHSPIFSIEMDDGEIQIYKEKREKVLGEYRMIQDRDNPHPMKLKQFRNWMSGPKHKVHIKKKILLSR